MLIRKIKKGIFEVLLEDDSNTQYRVEDSRVIGAIDRTYIVTHPWTVWENLGETEEDFWKIGAEVDDGKYTNLISEKSFKDCIFAISLWEEANEILN